MASVYISEIRNGMAFRHNNDIYSVISFQQVKQARSSGFYRVKMRSLNTGKIIEQSFNSGVKLDEIRVERRQYQFSYVNGDNLVFMNTETWEQVEMPMETVPGYEWLIEGDVCEVLFNTADDAVLSVDIPTHVEREISYTEPGLRGDTATNTLKPAKVQGIMGDVEVRVPLFINIGDKIKIDTANKEYVSRIKD
jgi:elongation factor P